MRATHKSYGAASRPTIDGRGAAPVFLSFPITKP